jgi:hypothetical protein
MIELLGDVGHVESCFGPFGDSVRSMEDKCKVCTKCVVGLEIVLDASVLVHLEIVLILTQDGCTICAECTGGSKIILDTHDKTAR